MSCPCACVYACACCAFAYTFACTFACAFACTCTRVRVGVGAHVRVRVHACMFECMRVHMSACTHMCTCVARVHVPGYARACMHTRTRAGGHVRVRVCMHHCVDVCVRVHTACGRMPSTDWWNDQMRGKAGVLCKALGRPINVLSECGDAQICHRLGRGRLLVCRSLPLSRHFACL